MSDVDIKDRFWFNSVGLMLGKLSKKRAKQMEEPEFYVIKLLYEKGNGTWSGLAGGDADSWNFLRSCCKAYLKVCKDLKMGPYKPEEDV